MKRESRIRRHTHWYWILGLALVPLLAAGLFRAYVAAQQGRRYDGVYFTPEYQGSYSGPGAVARKWEEVLNTGDPDLVAELTALRRPPTIEANPDVILTILLEIDDAGYYHYLYFDLQTYERLTYYVKQIKGRWVVVPEDAFYYWDSGRWLGIFAPVAIVWWLILLVAGVGISVFVAGARTRDAMFGG